MPVYAIENDRVVMQAEDGVFIDPSNPNNDDWTLDRSFAADKGDGVLLWDGPDYFAARHAGEPQTAPLRYDFQIEEAGTYYVSLRAIRPVTGEESDRNNDFFVQFEDQGYEKVFFSGPRETFRFADTADNNHNFSDVTFDVTDQMIAENNGVFSLYVAGRSHKAGLDEIHIQKDSVSKDHGAETSAVLDATAPVDVPDNDGPDTPAEAASDDTDGGGGNFFSDFFDWVFSLFGLLGGGGNDETETASATMSAAPDVTLSDVVPVTEVIVEDAQDDPQDSEVADLLEVA